jgi:hypothetical protein
MWSLSQLPSVDASFPHDSHLTRDKFNSSGVRTCQQSHPERQRACPTAVQSVASMRRPIHPTLAATRHAPGAGTFFGGSEIG